MRPDCKQKRNNQMTYDILVELTFKAAGEKYGISPSTARNIFEMTIARELGVEREKALIRNITPEWINHFEDLIPQTNISSATTQGA